ncbi:hypothetical protein FSARC_6456 [Fusarium sarcochroum]|uniref:Uncharacterized protein n=1 Tax=Fusarium sarcochroum TaxID=1208366 RepID=A0A8H4TXL6_9HYPO|nr:hypothetical protein FSARC_6456 [Fusarium sarcochroum]
MPTYLCHGFRWHRRDIRIFVILNDLEDAAPNWIIAPATSSCILAQLYTKYDFLPELTPPTTPTQPSVSVSKKLKPKDQHDHIDDDHSVPTSRVPDVEDGVLMHSWSAVKLLEEFDTDEMVTASRPYAYVADYVVRVDLSVDVAGQMAKYYDKMGGDDGWIVKLRNELQKGESVRWYVVVCGDEVREVPGESDAEDDEIEGHEGYEQIKERSVHPKVHAGEASSSFSDSPSEYDDDNEEDDALTVLEDILEESEGAATPRPLSRELPDIDIPRQPQGPDPNRASVLTTSTVWSQDESPNATARQETPDIDAPLQPQDLDPHRLSVSTRSSFWSQEESPNGGPGLGTPDVEMPLLHSENTRYSTSTASGFYSEYDHTQVEPEEFVKAQSPVRSPIRQENPDIVQPLKPEEILPSRSSTPPTPKPLQRQLPAPTLYRPESFIPPLSPSPPPLDIPGREAKGPRAPSRTDETKPPEPSWPLSSDSPQESSGSSTFHTEDTPLPLVTSLMASNERMAATLHLPKEVIPPRTPSPSSEYSPQPHIFGSTIPRFEDIVPHASPLLVSPNPAHLEQPSSGVLYEGGETISEQQSPSAPPTPKAAQSSSTETTVTKEAKDLVSDPSTSPTTPTLVQQETADPPVATKSRIPTVPPATQRSPKSRIPKSIRLPEVPLPPEPEVKTPVRPPTPPKPRSVRGGGPQRRPQTAPEEGTLPKTTTRGFSMPYRYELPSSLEELENEEVVFEPPPSVVSDYDWGENSEQIKPQQVAPDQGMRAPPPPPPSMPQTRQTSVSTLHSNMHTQEGGGHPKQRIGRSHSVAEGLKKLFRRPSHVKGGHP